MPSSMSSNSVRKASRPGSDIASSTSSRCCFSSANTSLRSWISNASSSSAGSNSISLKRSFNPNSGSSAPLMSAVSMICALAVAAISSALSCRSLVLLLIVAVSFLIASTLVLIWSMTAACAGTASVDVTIAVLMATVFKSLFMLISWMVGVSDLWCNFAALSQVRFPSDKDGSRGERSHKTPFRELSEIRQE